MTTTIDDCQLIKLDRFYDVRGSLTPVYNQVHIPFDIARTYYLYDVPGGMNRGGHAHKQLQQLIVCVMGAFDVVLDDGTQQKTVRLERAYYGLYIPSMIWRELIHFSSGAICLVLASLPYDEHEYLRHYTTFLKRKQAGHDPLS